MGDGVDLEEGNPGIFSVFRELCMDLEENIRRIKMACIDEYTLM